ncbi:hypothetical protein BH11BAC2_BH11BAC2_16810 [soil metagenome]
MRTISLHYPKAIFMALLFTLISVVQSFAVTYYSRTNGGLWNVNSTWSTFGYGSPINSGTYPQKGDVVRIGDGYLIYMNMNAVCASVTVGQGTSGRLEFSNYLSFTMTLAGTLTINNGASVTYTGNSSRIHSLFISGSIVNNGIMDVYADPNDLVNITFNSKVNSVISGTGTFDLNRVRVSKSTTTAYTLDVLTNTFETGTRQLDVSYGTYIHNNLGTYNVNPTLGAFTLGPDGIIKVPMGTMHLSPTNQFFFLEGSLIVNGGNLQVGFNSGVQGLRYAKNGTFTPSINITSGTLEVYGGITYKSGASTDPININISGGTLLLNSGSTGTALELLKVNDVAGSSFIMSAGSIVMQKPTSNILMPDLDLNGSTGTSTITGGYVEFGNASTPNNAVFSFMPYAGRPYPYFKVTGPAANTVTVAPSANSTSDFQTMGVYIEANKKFDVRSISGTPGDTRTMRLTDTYDGVSALINDGNFIARQGTVLLQAGEGQWLSGLTTTAFYNLTVNNIFGISLGSPVDVTGNLFMQVGIMYTDLTNIITCRANGSSNIGSTVSYVEGPFAQEVASISPITFSIPVGKTGIFRPMILSVIHTTAAPVVYTSEQFNSSAFALSYTLPGTLRWVSHIRYYTINRTSVANLSSARVTLSYGADDVVNDFNGLRVARDNGASGWLDIGGTGTANGTGSITSASFTGFNTIFTLGNAMGGINWLPVELVDFTAIKKTAVTDLKWSTASENNSSYYEIQRSANGLDFVPIGKVNAAGESNVLLNYRFTDNLPLKGINYYRLKQIDLDGAFTYTDTRAVRFAVVGEVSIYPNPSVNGRLNVVIPEAFSGNWVVQMFDLTGKMVFTQTGNSLDSKSFQIDAQEVLQAGIYSFHLISDNGQQWDDKIAIINE